MESNDRSKESGLKAEAGRYADELGAILLKENEEKPKKTPSPENFSKLSRKIAVAQRKQKMARAAHMVPAALNRVAVVFMVFVVILTLCVLTVDAVRFQLIDILESVNGPYLSVHIRGGTYENWEEQSAPQYIPEGYQLVDFKLKKDILLIQFEDTQENTLVFSKQDIAAGVEDSERTDEMKGVIVNGKKGMLVRKGDETALFWDSANNSFRVQGKLPEDELIKIAESVR